MTQYIFIVTTPRAGSTLAQSLLLNIDGVVSAPETHFFSLLNTRNFMKLKFYNIDELVFKSYEAIGAQPPVISRFQPRWRKRITQDFKNKIDGLLLENSGECFLEKTPMHLHYIEEITTTFENSFFIHIERDMYDNVMSLYRATNTYPSGWGGRRNIKKCVGRWQHDKSLHDKYRMNENHLFFDYDDIVNDPGKYISSVASKIGMPWSGIIDLEKNKDIITAEEPWKVSNFNKVGQTENHINILSRAEFEERYLKGDKL